MALCGSNNGCGCALTSTPALSGAIGGQLPTINVAGSGQPGDAWDITLNDAWAERVVFNANRHGVDAVRNTAQTLAASALTTVTFNTETQDTDGYFTPGGSVVFVPPGLSGLYAVSAEVRLSIAPAGYIRLNYWGSTKLYDSPIVAGAAAVSAVIAMTEGSSVTLACYNPAGAGNINSASLSMYRVGE